MTQIKANIPQGVINISAIACPVYEVLYVADCGCLLDDYPLYP